MPKVSKRDLIDKQKKEEGNTMGYTIPDVKKLLSWLEGKFTIKMSDSQKKKLKEEIIKIIEQ